MKPLIAAAWALSLSGLSAGAQRPTLAEWRLGAAPLLAIGEGWSTAEFLRIAGAFRLRDGRVAVVNGGSFDIQFFGADGRPLQTLGRQGAGPGEFRGMGWAGRAGDTLFVYDGGNRRVTAVHLASPLRVLHSVAITAQGGREPFAVTGRLADGRWLVGIFISPRFDGPPGVSRYKGSFGLVAPDGSGDVAWFAEVPSAAIFAHSPTGNVRQAAVGPIAFTPWHRAAVSGSTVWFGESGSDSLSAMGARGTTTIRLPMPARAPSPELIAEARRDEEARSGGRGVGAFGEAKYSARYLPRTLPYHGAFVPGPDGELWVEEYTGSSAAPTRYLVVSGRVQPVAWVPVPAGFRVLEAGADYLLGVQRDEDGVETVRLYGLQRR